MAFQTPKTTPEVGGMGHSMKRKEDIPLSEVDPSRESEPLSRNGEVAHAAEPRRCACVALRRPQPLDVNR